MPKVKRTLFFKAHVNDYTKKDGTVVVAHDDNRPLAARHFAQAAVAVSGRVSEKSAQREQGMKSSAAAGVATKAAQAPREHAAAAKAHDDAAKIHRDAANAGKYDLGLAGAAQDHRAAAQSHEWAAAAHREEAGNVSNEGEAPKPPSFHVTREDEGEQFIDSTHDKFSSAKQRMMDVHHEDPHASPLVHSMPHGILAFPHVDTGKATLTPAYKRAADAAHPDHKEHWADQ